MVRQSWETLQAQDLTASQRALVAWPPPRSGAALWGHGSAATGKSTALVWRILRLLEAGERADRILCLVPQRAQVERYEAMLASRLLAAPDPETGPGSMAVQIITYYGLCRRLVALFWPALAPLAGFARPEAEPVFLTIEAAEYYMWGIAEPLIQREGYFRELSIQRGRLLSQLLDNLNKSALVGFAPEEIGQRLARAWVGEAERLISYQQAQECALSFRRHCLDHNLVDFSLTTALTTLGLERVPEMQAYLRRQVDHLLVDNLEENVPVAQRFIGWLRQAARSIVLLSDEPGGYRVFLGADAAMAQELASTCDETLLFDEPVAGGAASIALGCALVRALRAEPPALRVPVASPRDALLDQTREDYWITAARWTARHIAELVVEQGVSPAQIAVIAPYVSDVMQFALREELVSAGVPVHLLRPAALLRDDPVIRALLTLTLLAHPQWIDELGQGALAPRVQDLGWALANLIHGLDPIRAAHLARSALDAHLYELKPLDEDDGGEAGRVWERVGYQVRPLYGALRRYIAAYRTAADPQPVDQFLSGMFGAVLCQPDYAFAVDPAAARSLGKLVESAAKFRSALAVGQQDVSESARRYVEAVLSGIASADYRADWATEPISGVVLAPAYAYLTRDLHSAYQFWLDLGSVGWWTRPNQPLTHPYVLSARWPKEAVWTEAHEEAERQQGLVRVLYGLAVRCGQGVYLASSDLGLSGEPADSRLERVLLRVLAEGEGHGAAS